MKLSHPEVRQYHPDAWTIVKVTSDIGHHYRVFAGWYGGYIGSDSWKMNSGITKYEDNSEFIKFYGESGSVYNCHHNTERMTGYMMQIYSNFKSQEKDGMKIDLVDYADFVKEFK